MFSKLLQAVLRHDKRLLSEETWRLAEQDALKAIGAKVPVPMVRIVREISDERTIDEYHDAAPLTLSV